ncbi:MAG: DUF523 domain-containing protein [Sulfurovum sp.]
MKKIAISACLLGQACRYDGDSNLNIELIERIKGNYLIPFCPEDYAFGSPRATMDLVDINHQSRAISNADGRDLSNPIKDYAKAFFSEYRDVDLYIGKDRSPSCGVCSAKVYDIENNLISSEGIGIMAKEAVRRGVETIDAEEFLSS